MHELFVLTDDWLYRHIVECAAVAVIYADTTAAAQR